MRGLVLAIALAHAGCGPRATWMADESDRITAGMRAEPFRTDMPGAEGIAFADSAVAAPFDSPRLELSQSRERRSGGARRRLPPRAARQPRLAGSAVRN